MKKGYITVNLFRVSSDSEYLHVHLQCTEDYYFDTFKLEVHYSNQSKIEWFDLSDSLFINRLGEGKNPTTLDTEQVINIPLSKLNIPLGDNGYRIPAIYIGHVTAKYRYDKKGFPVPYQNPQVGETIYCIKTLSDGFKYICYTDKYIPIGAEDERVIDWNDNYVLAGEPYTEETPVIIDKMYASDVNMVYKCILSELTDESNCNQLSDTSIRNYLLLYGHLAALTNWDLDQAEIYLNLISNCFSKCATTPTYRSEKTHSCNCKR